MIGSEMKFMKNKAVTVMKILSQWYLDEYMLVIIPPIKPDKK